MRYFRTKRGNIITERTLKDTYFLVCGVNMTSQELAEDWPADTILEYFLGLEEEVTDVVTPELCLDCKSISAATNVYAEQHDISFGKAMEKIKDLVSERKAALRKQKEAIFHGT